jgi:hypothetical protein
MGRSSGLVIALFLVSCGTDYNVAGEKPEEHPGRDEDTSKPVVDTDDPIPEETGDPIIDSGGTTVDPEAPVAVCAVNPTSVHPPYESAQWLGTGSYDPMGQEITGYTWTLVSQPSGSSVTMPSCSSSVCSGFKPDLAGTYTGRLVVKTADGRTSPPCETDLEAVPTEDFWVEMYWTHANDDMDLHLLAPGGTFQDMWGTDCYYINCTPSMGSVDWGVMGDSSDDPTLDLDDIPGVGPENINIQDPGNGDYTVIVHDYTGSTPDYTGGNSVTVNIYVGGSLVWTDTRSISGDGSAEYFAKVSWPSGTVTSL